MKEHTCAEMQTPLVCECAADSNNLGDDTVNDGASASVSFDHGIIGSDPTPSDLEDESSNFGPARTDATPSPTAGTSPSSSASASAGAAGLPAALPFHTVSIIDMELRSSMMIIGSSH